MRLFITEFAKNKQTYKKIYKFTVQVLFTRSHNCNSLSI
jgi:hypothetical protein